MLHTQIWDTTSNSFYQTKPMFVQAFRAEADTRRVAPESGSLKKVFPSRGDFAWNPMGLPGDCSRET
jgi:hypothetical protein